VRGEFARETRRLREEHDEMSDDRTDAEKGSILTADTKQCPFCAEDIKAAAIVCKHCGRDLQPVLTSELLAAPVAPPQPKPSASKRLVTLVFYLVVAFAGLTLLFAFFNGHTPNAPPRKTMNVRVAWNATELQIQCLGQARQRRDDLRQRYAALWFSC
jgi:hypothetical protein